MYVHRVQPITYEQQTIVELLPPIPYERMSDEIVAIERAGYSLIPITGHEPFSHVLKVRNDRVTRYTHYLAEMTR